MEELGCIGKEILIYYKGLKGGNLRVGVGRGVGGWRGE
jgi:hypothetical protein